MRFARRLAATGHASGRALTRVAVGSSPRSLRGSRLSSRQILARRPTLRTCCRSRSRIPAGRARPVGCWMEHEVVSAHCCQRLTEPMRSFRRGRAPSQTVPDCLYLGSRYHQSGTATGFPRPRRKVGVQVHLDAAALELRSIAGIKVALGRHVFSQQDRMLVQLNVEVTRISHACHRWHGAAVHQAPNRYQHTFGVDRVIRRQQQIPAWHAFTERTATNADGSCRFGPRMPCEVGASTADPSHRPRQQRAIAAIAASLEHSLRGSPRRQSLRHRAEFRRGRCVHLEQYVQLAVGSGTHIERQRRIETSERERSARPLWHRWSTADLSTVFRQVDDARIVRLSGDDKPAGDVLRIALFMTPIHFDGGRAHDFG